MQDGTFNTYWFMSLIAPAVIMAFAGYYRRRVVFIVAAVISVMATYTLSNVAVQEKWRIRNATAVTEAEMERATADGANLAFTAFVFAPIEAVAYTWFWGWLGWRIGAKRAPASNNTIERWHER